MATTILTSESTLTDKYQTTVPDPVRRALQLGKKDKIRYQIESSGKVILSRAELGQSDPAIESFLNFLAQDIQSNPKNLKALTPSLVSKIESLVGDIEVDLDAPLNDEDD